MSDTNETVELRIGDETYSFPVTEGTENEKGFAIGALRSQTGYITLDPGYASTGACQSAITFLDGEKGVLRHRGYSIEDLAENASFMEVTYLLLFGELPKAQELEEFEGLVREHYHLSPEIVDMVRDYPKHGHPMAVLSSATTALSGMHPDVDESDPAQFRLSAARMIGKFISIGAYAYRKHHGKDYIAPDTALAYCENLVHMMFGDQDLCDSACAL